MMCKWEDKDTGICINADCPLCADYCFKTYGIPGICKYEDREERDRETD